MGLGHWPFKFGNGFNEVVLVQKISIKRKPYLFHRNKTDTCLRVYVECRFQSWYKRLRRWHSYDVWSSFLNTKRVLILSVLARPQLGSPRLGPVAYWRVSPRTEFVNVHKFSGETIFNTFNTTRRAPVVGFTEAPSVYPRLWFKTPPSKTGRQKR